MVPAVPLVVYVETSLKGRNASRPVGKKTACQKSFAVKRRLPWLTDYWVSERKERKNGTHQQKLNPVPLGRGSRSPGVLFDRLRILPTDGKAGRKFESDGCIAVSVESGVGSLVSCTAS